MPEVDPTHASACSQARIRYDLVLGFRHQIFVVLVLVQAPRFGGAPTA